VASIASAPAAIIVRRNAIVEFLPINSFGFQAEHG
jgi:hypothetical protein